MSSIDFVRNKIKEMNQKLKSKGDVYGGSEMYYSYDYEDFVRNGKSDIWKYAKPAIEDKAHTLLDQDICSAAKLAQRIKDKVYDLTSASYITSTYSGDVICLAIMLLKKQKVIPEDLNDIEIILGYLDIKEM